MEEVQGCLYIGPRDQFKAASGFDFENSSNIQLMLKITFYSLYLCLTHGLVWILLLNINHIAICVCNSFKCWFKHLVP